MPTTTKKRGRRPASAGQKTKRREQVRQEVDELRGRLDSAVEELTTVDGWQRMLTGAMNLYKYSFRNQLLILAQAAERGFTPSRVAGYRAWQDEGRQVSEGETGLRILSPRTMWVAVDEDTDLSQALEVYESPTGRRAKFRTFRPISVFDIAQTHGVDDLDQDQGAVTASSAPTPVAIEDDPQALAELRRDLADQVEAAGFALSYGPTRLGTLGVTNFQANTVVINDAQSVRDQVATLAHELAHIVCGHGDQLGPAHEGRREVEAESVAYIVLGAHGFDLTSAVPYVAGFSKGDMETIAEAAETVTTAARAILTAGDVDEDESAEQDETAA